MASDKKTVRELLITCSICTKPFTDPHVLPCLHSYCLKCIRDEASKNHDQFRCPQSDGTNIDKDQIELLSPNQTIREIMTLSGESFLRIVRSVTNVDTRSKWGKLFFE
jgi:hypothetical protein